MPKVGGTLTLSLEHAFANLIAFRFTLVSLLRIEMRVDLELGHGQLGHDHCRLAPFIAAAAQMGVGDPRAADR